MLYLVLLCVKKMKTIRLAEEFHLKRGPFALSIFPFFFLGKFFLDFGLLHLNQMNTDLCLVYPV